MTVEERIEWMTKFLYQWGGSSETKWHNLARAVEREIIEARIEEIENLFGKRTENDTQLIGDALKRVFDLRQELTRQKEGLKENEKESE